MISASFRPASEGMAPAPASERWQEVHSAARWAAVRSTRARLSGSDGTCEGHLEYEPGKHDDDECHKRAAKHYHPLVMSLHCALKRLELSIQPLHAGRNRL